MISLKSHSENKPDLSKSKWAASIRKGLPLHLMMLPGVIALILFAYIPMYGVIMAFQNYNIVDGYLKSPFVGLAHFRTLFEDPYFLRLLRNTVGLSVTTLCFSFPAPIIFAILLNECRRRRYKGIIQSVSYLPHFIPTVVMVGIMYELFGAYGLVNNLLQSIGADTQSFFSNPGWFYPLYIGSALWKSVGWGSIIYMGALTNIDPSMYEAAEMDGANRLQKIRYITLPFLKPTIVTLLILEIGGIMSVSFEKVFLMYSPAIYEVADVLSTYVYRQGITNANYSYAAAVDLFNNVVSVILVLAADRLAKKFGEDGII